MVSPCGFEPLTHFSADSGNAIETSLVRAYTARLMPLQLLMPGCNHLDIVRTWEVMLRMHSTTRAETPHPPSYLGHPLPKEEG